MIIKNARVYTMTQDKIIENGYVKISGGLICEVGTMQDYAEGSLSR